MQDRNDYYEKITLSHNLVFVLDFHRCWKASNAIAVTLWLDSYQDASHVLHDRYGNMSVRCMHIVG